VVGAVEDHGHALCVLAFGEDDNELFSLPSKGYGLQDGPSWAGPGRRREKRREAKERDGPPGKRGRGLPAGPSQAWPVGRSAPFLFLF
jgi:hypothetical protein